MSHSTENHNVWQKSKYADKYVRRQIELMALLIVVLISTFAVFLQNTGDNINRNLHNVWSDFLDEQIAHVNKLIFDENPYLTPDKAYLAKLKTIFYTGSSSGGQLKREETKDTVLAWDNILFNIRKGIQYVGDMRSTYLMLADPDAHYIIANGMLKHRDDIPDVAWQGVCRAMLDDTYVEWRPLPLSYLRSVDVITIYRRITSTHWATGEKTVGYWIMNFDRTHIVNAISRWIDASESVYLYNATTRQGLYIGGDIALSKSLEKLLSEHMDAQTNGQVNAQGRIVQPAKKSSYYYAINHLSGNLYVLVSKDVNAKMDLSHFR